MKLEALFEKLGLILFALWENPQEKPASTEANMEVITSIMNRSFFQIYDLLKVCLIVCA